MKKKSASEFEKGAICALASICHGHGCNADVYVREALTAVVGSDFHWRGIDEFDLEGLQAAGIIEQVKGGEWRIRP